MIEWATEQRPKLQDNPDSGLQEVPDEGYYKYIPVTRYRGPNADQPFLQFDTHEEWSKARLEKGGDAYVLAPLKKRQSNPNLRDGFEAYGAIGPPIEWILLGTVKSNSSESGRDWVITRTIGALAWTAHAVFVPIHAILGFASSVALSPLDFKAHWRLFRNGVLRPDFPRTPW